MDEDMYYPGSLNGNRGLVPCNFVSQIESPVKSQTDSQQKSPVDSQSNSQADPQLKSPGNSQSNSQSNPPEQSKSRPIQTVNPQFAKSENIHHKSILKSGDRVKCIKDCRDREKFCLNIRKGDEIEVVKWENDENEIQTDGWFMGKLIKGSWGNSKYSRKGKFHASYVSGPFHEKTSVWSRIGSIAQF